MPVSFARCGCGVARGSMVLLAHSVLNCCVLLFFVCFTSFLLCVDALHRKLAGSFMACIRLGANVECRSLLEQLYVKRWGEDAS